MKSPLGIELEIGQKWQEVDPRFERVVTVTGFDVLNDKVLLNGRTKAKLSRFNGKRGGYKPV